MVSLLTPDVRDFIEEAKGKSVTAVTLLSNRKKLSRACELPQSGTRSPVPHRFIGSALTRRARKSTGEKTADIQAVPGVRGPTEIGRSTP